MLKVLSVEDDAGISNLISITLKEQGYQVTSATDGISGLHYLESDTWDVVLLDLMLPGISGYDLLKIACKRGYPVIIISAMNDVDDRVKGLRLGADDYVCKPFQLAELIARVETVIRRSSKQMDVFEFRDIVVDFKSRTILKSGDEVYLTVKEFDLLETLIRNKNIALTREYLYETIWMEEYTGQKRTLDNNIQTLRKKLGVEDVIQTVFRIGYRFRI